ncbi:MAG: FKBP-type peptidyl-prolyl cis-trans isomerase, partial [Planctomycetota bacterium]
LALCAWTLPVVAQDDPASADASTSAAPAVEASAAASEAAPATQPESLAESRQRHSYVIGRQLGQGVRSLGLQLDRDALALGLEDADRVARGLDPAHMTPPQFQDAVVDYGRALQARAALAQQEALSQQLVDNRMASDEYLGRYAQQPTANAFQHGGYYRELRQGQGDTARPGQLAKFHVSARLPDGPVFLDTRDRGAPAEFLIDPNRLPAPGWFPALSQMRVGGVWELALPAEQAFGDLGLPELGVGPEQALQFELELIEVNDAPSGAAAASDAAVEAAGHDHDHHDHDHAHGHDHHDHAAPAASPEDPGDPGDPAGAAPTNPEPGDR